MKLISKGNTAEIFKYDDNLICKLFYLGYPKRFIEHELDNAKVVSQLGIKTPKAYKLICINERHGIIFDKIVGETLLSKMNSANEEELVVWIHRFADNHKEMLKYRINDVLDYKDFLRMFASDSVEVIDKINALDEGDCLLHGDFHPANIMIDVNNQWNLIDMMNVCKGPALYDIARTFFLLGNDIRLQNTYLELMGCKLEDVMPYLEVILMIREKEIKMYN